MAKKLVIHYFYVHHSVFLNQSTIFTGCGTNNTVCGTFNKKKVTCKHCLKQMDKV